MFKDADANNPKRPKIFYILQNLQCCTTNAVWVIPNIIDILHKFKFFWLSLLTEYLHVYSLYMTNCLVHSELWRPTEMDNCRAGAVFHPLLGLHPFSVPVFKTHNPADPQLCSSGNEVEKNCCSIIGYYAVPSTIEYKWHLNHKETWKY